MKNLKRPSKWKIEIWEKEDKWHQKYIELFPNTNQFKELIKITIPLVNLMLSKTGFIKFEIEEIEMDEMIGVLITTISNELKPIVDNLLSEFIFMSSLGEITLKDIFLIGINAVLTQDSVIEARKKVVDKIVEFKLTKE